MLHLDCKATKLKTSTDCKGVTFLSHVVLLLFATKMSFVFKQHIVWGQSFNFFYTLGQI